MKTENPHESASVIGQLARLRIKLFRVEATMRQLEILANSIREQISAIQDFCPHASGVGGDGLCRVCGKKV